MARTLYLDCSSGISGDMLLSSLLGMADEKVLRNGLDRLGLSSEFQLEITDVVRVCAAKKVDVITTNISNASHEHELHEHNHEHDHEHNHDHEHEHEHEHNHNHNHNHEHKHENHEHDHKHHDHEHGHNHEHHSHEHEHHSHEHEHECAGGSDHPHHYHNHGRTYADIVDIIKSSTLDDKTKNLALQIFDTLAVAEAQAHAVAINDVHFHEVGAIDSIVDIVGFSILYNHLDISGVEINSINLGSGTVKCQHGILAVPVPAVTNMLQGFVVHAMGTFERATPTGIAILKAVGASYAVGASGKVIATGCGAGSFHSENDRNTLNSVLLERDEASPNSCAARESVIVVATNIDNSTGEQLGYLAQILLEQGALDVWFSPIFMKKFRPAYKLELMCTASEKDKLIELIFQHSGTIGVRITAADRVVLPRKSASIMTSYGEVRIKTYGDGETRTAASEHVRSSNISQGSQANENSQQAMKQPSQATANSQQPMKQPSQANENSQQTSRQEIKHKFEYDSLVMVAKKCNCTLTEAQAKLEKELYD